MVVDFAELAVIHRFPADVLQLGHEGARSPIRWRRISVPTCCWWTRRLAVGDLAFQHKCIRHMRQFVSGGGSLLLVSHNVQQVQTVCDRAILIDRGRVAMKAMWRTRSAGCFEQRPLADANQLRISRRTGQCA